MRFSLLVAGLFALLIAISCSKMNNNGLKQKPVLQLREADVTPENTSNPEDDAGQIHNQFLDEYLSYCNTYPDASSADVRNHMNNWFMDEFEVELGATNAGFSFEEPSLPERVIPYLGDLDDIGNTYFIYNGDYSNLKYAIVELEDEIMLDELLSSDEKVFLLNTTSIARFSAYYWWPYNDETNVAKNVWKEDKDGYAVHSGEGWKHGIVKVGIAAFFSAHAGVENLRYNLKKWAHQFWYGEYNP